MELKDLLKGLPFEVYSGSLTVPVSGITQDSRNVHEGGCFIAIKGYRQDGHVYLQQVIEQGAGSLIITDTAQLPTISSQTVIVVREQDVRRVMSAVAARYYGQPSRKLKIVGLTGTNGKTSTARLIGDLLQAAGLMTGVLGTIQNQVGKKVYASKLTTPEPIELHRLLAEMVTDGVDACVMEASSHALELHRVTDVEYDVGVFTNLTEDHMDFHPDFEAYYEAKKRLFSLVSNTSLINGDDPYGKRLIDELSLEKNILPYGIDGLWPIRAEHIQYSPSGSTFTFVTPAFSIPVQVPIPGKIYVYNALAALGTLYVLGFDAAVIANAATAMKPVPGRMEPVKGKRDITVLVDYAHTPDALKNALEIVRGLTDKKVRVVFGCGGDRDRAKRPEMGRVADQMADVLYVTSDNPRTEDPERIVEDVLSGIERTEALTVQVDRERAIRTAIEEAASGDVVLIAGKGHETYQEVNGVRHSFDDREKAKQYLTI